MDLPRVPYRAEAYSPAWFAPNARSNFCEEDYIVTPYIAELVNTLTNISYVIYAYHGIRRLRNNRDATLLSLPYLGLAAVGICSAIFHATMTYAGQMADDLSMILATSLVLHRAYSAGRPAAWSRRFAVALMAAFAVFAAYHCWADELRVHFLLFATTTCAVWRKTRILIRERRTRGGVGDVGVVRELRVLARVGAASSAIGFALWNVDRKFCDQLVQARRAMGMPWGFVLELHGWWHIFTAIGAYTFMALVEILTAGEGEGDAAFAWPVGAYSRRESGMKKD